MTISKRASALPMSSIYVLEELAHKAEQQGKKVHRLNIGQPDIAPPPEAIECLKSLSNPLLRYADTKGLLSLRKEIALYYKELGSTFGSENIVITQGASEAIKMALLSICDAGDSVLVPEPFYANLSGFAAEAEVELIPISRNLKDGFTLPPTYTWQNAIKENTRAFWICNPGNPEGYLYTAEDLKAIASFCKMNDLMLVSDEVYRGLEGNEGGHCSVFCLYEMEQQSVVLDSFSKRFNLPSARVGCLSTKNKKVMKAAELMAVNRLTASFDGQRIAEEAIKNRKNYLNLLQNTYRKRREIASNWAYSLPKYVKSYIGQGAFYCMIDIDNVDAFGFCKWMLSSYDPADNETVLLSPASGFYADPEDGKSQLRIALVEDQQELIKALNIISSALQLYKKEVQKSKVA